jgi:hypothetical protein
MTVNRETARDGLTSLLTTALTGIAASVVGHRLSDPAGQTPVVAVLSASSDRPRMTFQGNRAVFRLLVQILILAEDATGYTEADAEDKLDLVEKTVSATVEANAGATAYWSHIEQA